MSTPPPTFENYPGQTPAAGSGPATSGLNEPNGDHGWRPIVPAPSPQPPVPRPSGSTRRGLLVGVGLLGIVGVAGAAGGMFAASDTGPVGRGSAPADPSDPGATTIQAGEYPVIVPAGWRVEESTSDSVVLSRGIGRITFRQYTAGSDVTAPEEATRLLNRYAGEVRGRRSITPGRSSVTDELMRARVTTTGTVDTKPVDVSAEVVIRVDERLALGVIAVLPRDLRQSDAKAARTVITEYLDQLG